jgi:hypothetical protein
VKIRAWLKRLRPQSVQIGEGRRQEDNVDAIAAGHDAGKGGIANVAPGATVPPNYVPSQQDWGRPRH